MIIGASSSRRTITARLSWETLDRETWRTNIIIALARHARAVALHRRRVCLRNAHSRVGRELAAAYNYKWHAQKRGIDTYIAERGKSNEGREGGEEVNYRNDSYFICIPALL